MFQIVYVILFYFFFDSEISRFDSRHSRRDSQIIRLARIQKRLESAIRFPGGEVRLSTAMQVHILRSIDRSVDQRLRETSLSVGPSDEEAIRFDGIQLHPPDNKVIG